LFPTVSSLSCALDGRTILVAEDEPLVGLDIADTLQAAGAKIVRALKLEDAVNLARTAELSAAILDINLVGEDCLPVCQLLADRNIPFVFNTGYSERPVLEKWPDAPHLKAIHTKRNRQGGRFRFEGQLGTGRRMNVAEGEEASAAAPSLEGNPGAPLWAARRRSLLISGVVAATVLPVHKRATATWPFRRGDPWLRGDRTPSFTGTPPWTCLVAGCVIFGRSSASCIGGWQRAQNDCGQ
jgi:CheY-like chemotaxis protein